MSLFVLPLVVQGSTSLGTVNEILDTEFRSEDFEIIGGLSLARLGRAPEVGDSMNLDSYAFEVDEVSGSRISHMVARKAAQRNVDSSN